MAKQCALCGKKGRMVWKLTKLRGKYNPSVKRRKHPNLQWVTLASGLPTGKAGKRIKACTKCIKALAKRK